MMEMARVGWTSKSMLMLGRRPFPFNLCSLTVDYRSHSILHQPYPVDYGQDTRALIDKESR